MEALNPGTWCSRWMLYVRLKKMLCENIPDDSPFSYHKHAFLSPAEDFTFAAGQFKPIHLTYDLLITAVQNDGRYDRKKKKHTSPAVVLE